MRTQLINFSIPKELLKKVDQVAKKQYMSRSEALREAARRLVKEARQRERDFALIARSGKRINLPEDEAIMLVDKICDKLPLNR